MPAVSKRHSPSAAQLAAWSVLLVLLALLAPLAACSSPDPTPAGLPSGTGPGFPYAFTGDVPADAAVADAGAIDVGAADAATPVDAALLDVGSPDIGAGDSGGVDSTPTQDAGADAGLDTGPKVSCGDGTCTAEIETCQTCPADCNVCPAVCGNGSCEGPGETCLSCAQDCGACGAVCGDGACTKDKEDCKSCPQDCNVCPAYCGDGACAKDTEDCASCAADCGNCPTFCGNGKCELPAESYSSCPKDCPPTGTCDPLTSNGCVASDQCYPTTADPACAKVGVVAEGAFCQLSTQCVKGHLCVGEKCRRICDHTGANKLVGCPLGAICDKLVYNSGKDVGWNMGQCITVDICNLTTEVGCPIAETCVISPNGKICIKAGEVTAGGACKFASDCAKGLICIGEPGICKPKCHLKGGVPTCKTGKCSLVTIQDPGKPAQPAPDDLGVCG